MQTDLSVIPAPVEHSEAKPFDNNDARQDFFHELIRIVDMLAQGDPPTIQNALGRIERFRVYGNEQFIREPRITLSVGGGMFIHIYRDEALEVYHAAVMELLKDAAAAFFYAADLPVPEDRMPVFERELERYTLVGHVQRFNPRLTFNEVLDRLPFSKERPDGVMPGSMRQIDIPPASPAIVEQMTCWTVNPPVDTNDEDVVNIRRLAAMVSEDISQPEKLEEFLDLISDLGFHREDFPGEDMVLAVLKGYTEQDIGVMYIHGHTVPHQWAPRFPSEFARADFVDTCLATARKVGIPTEGIEERIPKFRVPRVDETLHPVVKTALSDMATRVFATREEMTKGTSHDENVPMAAMNPSK